MSSLLNDVMLKKLTCSTCHKYLSVLPIKVYPNRVIKCGRCSAENDGGTESMYNTIAKNYVFKCVNRYERCNKLLTISEVVEHEKQCKGDRCRCPKCDKFFGSAHQLVLHYSSQHPRSIIKNYLFSIKVRRNFREQYLLLVKDNIFFVLVDNLANENVLYLSAVSLINCRNVKYWFTVRALRKQKIITTAVKPCYSLHNFECDYMYVKTNSMTEVSCRVHLDLSEHVNVVDQIPLLRNAELNELKISPVCKTDEDSEPQPQVIPSVSVDSQTSSAKDEVGIILTDEFRTRFPGYELTSSSEHVSIVDQIPLQRSTELSEMKINLVSKADEDTKPQPPKITSALTASDCQKSSSKDPLEVILTDEFSSEHVNIVCQIPPKKFAELNEPKINPVSKTDEDTEPQPQETPSASTDSQESPAKDVLEVILTDEFKKEYPGYELTPCGTALFKGDKIIELACSNCKELTGCNVFNYRLNRHIVCWNCKAWCGICNTSINDWNVTLANINELLMLPCRWQCGRNLLGNDMAEHELICENSGFSWYVQ